MTPSNKPRFSDVSWIFVAIITVFLLLALWQIRTILLLALASVILVVLLTVPVRFLMARVGLGRTPAILLSLTGSVVMLVILSLLVLPTLFRQFEKLATVTIPAGVERLIEWWNSGQLYEQFPILEGTLENMTINNDLLNELISQTSTALGQLGGSVLPLVGGVANTFLSLTIIIFLTMFLLAEPKRYAQGIIRLTPIWYRHRTATIMSRIYLTLRAWWKVTGVSMIVAGVGTGIGLALLGIREWAALGVLTGALSFIPNFGPLVSLIPAIAVGAVQVPGAIGLIVLVVYGVSFIQSQIVAPVLANENMNLPPVLVLIGQIIFGILFGFLGLMLAVPLTAILMILVDEIYVKDVLGDTYVRPVHDPVEEFVELLPEAD